MLWLMFILIGFVRLILDLESMLGMFIGFLLQLSWWLPNMLKTCEFSSPLFIVDTSNYLNSIDFFFVPFSIFDI